MLEHLSPSRSIRLRLTLLGAILLIGGLALGALAFDRVLENRLVDNLDQTLLTQANDRAAALAQGLDPEAIRTSIGRENAIAVFDPSGTLLESQGFDDPSELAQLELTPGTVSTHTVELVELRENEIEAYEVRIAAATGAGGVVVVAAELEQVNKSLGTVRTLLVVGIPLAGAASALLFWVLTGRALHPVERLRRDAQQIADVGHGGRVTEPENTDEIGRLAATLNDMLGQLDASTLALRRFVSDASHEIRSPVASIRARVETGDAREFEAIRADVVGEVERMEAIIDDLTWLARSDEGHVSSEFVRVELDGMLFDEARRLQQRDLVRVDASRVGPVVARADRAQLGRVVRNLVDNAERHASSAVGLGVHAEDSAVVLRVDDDGPGIAVDDRSLVFQRFARLDSARGRATGGTGLGLAIVADIVARHGGSVAVHDSPLGGARIEIRLPHSDGSGRLE
ncbi:MAG: sensor histidine kinase [Acidimicrobiales bacterium]